MIHCYHIFSNFYRLSGIGLNKNWEQKSSRSHRILIKQYTVSDLWRLLFNSFSEVCKIGEFGIIAFLVLNVLFQLLHLFQSDASQIVCLSSTVAYSDLLVNITFSVAGKLLPVEEVRWLKVVEVMMTSCS